MANSSINSVLHQGSMLPHEFPLASLQRPASFHSFSSTWAITNGALHVSPKRWNCSASSCCFRFRECRCRWKRIVRSCSTSEFVISNDENYSNKQVVSLTPRLYDYVLKNVREPEVRTEEDTILLHSLFNKKRIIFYFFWGGGVH